MGLGILTIGYGLSFLCSIHAYGAYFRLLGYLLLYLALRKLHPYQPDIRFARYAAISLIACSLFDSVLLTLSWTGVTLGGIPNDSVRYFLSIADVILASVFHVLLLLSLRKLAYSVCEPKLADRCVYSLVILGFFFAVWLFLTLPIPGLDNELKSYFNLVYLLLRVAFAVYTMFVLFCFYRQICDENDEEMARKPSRFAFINRLREKQDKRWEEKVERSRQKSEQAILRSREKNSGKRKKGKKK